MTFSRPVIFMVSSDRLGIYHFAFLSKNFGFITSSNLCGKGFTLLVSLRVNESHESRIKTGFATLFSTGTALNSQVV